MLTCETTVSCLGRTPRQIARAIVQMNEATEAGALMEDIDSYIGDGIGGHSVDGHDAEDTAGATTAGVRRARRAAAEAARMERTLSTALSRAWAWPDGYYADLSITVS